MCMCSQPQNQTLPPQADPIEGSIAWGNGATANYSYSLVIGDNVSDNVAGQAVVGTTLDGETIPAKFAKAVIDNADAFRWFLSRTIKHCVENREIALIDESPEQCCQRLEKAGQ